MIIVTGDGRIIECKTKNEAIKILIAAQKRGDQKCSITGAYSMGLSPEEILLAAGYTGKSIAKCESILRKTTIPITPGGRDAIERAKAMKLANRNLYRKVCKPKKGEKKC
jgi:hypothetical protein